MRVSVEQLVSGSEAAATGVKLKQCVEHVDVSVEPSLDGLPVEPHPVLERARAGAGREHEGVRMVIWRDAGAEHKAEEGEAGGRIGAAGMAADHCVP